MRGAAATRSLAGALFEQGLGAALNFATMVAVARRAPIEVFGAFALAWTFHSFVIYAWDYWFGPSAMLSRRADPESRPLGPGLMYTYARLPAIFAGVALLYLVTLRDLPAALALTTVSVSWVVLTSFRYLAYAQLAKLRYRLLLTAYAVALATTIAALASVSADWRLPVFCQAAVSGVLVVGVLAAYGARADRSAARQFGRNVTTAPGTVPNLSLQVVIQAGIPLLVNLVAGAATLAAFRGARSVVGPLLQVPQGLQPLLVRRITLHDDPTRVIRWWSAANGIVLSLAAVAMSFLPDAVGHEVLGATWPTAKPVLMWVMLAGAANQVVYALEVLVRLRGEVQRLLRFRALLLLPSAALVVALTVTMGAVGAGIAVLATNAVSVVVVGRWVRRYQRSPQALADDSQLAAVGLA